MMTQLSAHHYFKDTGNGSRFVPPAMAKDLVEALNEIDQRGGWRASISKEYHFRQPFEISRSNSYSITVQMAYPNDRRGHVSLSIGLRPDYVHDLPCLPQCTFDPARQIASIARDILRKIDREADEIVKAWLDRLREEDGAAKAHQALLRRLERLTGKPLRSNGSSTRYFQIGPLKCRVEEAGPITIDSFSYVSELELREMSRLFKGMASNEKPVCRACGSSDLTLDASVVWNEAIGNWEVTNVFDKGGHCDGCGDNDARWEFRTEGKAEQ